MVTTEPDVADDVQTAESTLAELAVAAFVADHRDLSGYWRGSLIGRWC